MHGYNEPTNASGQVTLTLPMGNYRFRADKNGQQYFSGTADHCSLPGCITATITIPVVNGFMGGVKVLASLPLLETSLSSTPMAGLQQSETVTTTVIRYTYDPLGRLTSADYSTGESFAYAYDEVGNRTAQTATITSTQVTTYVYDAANRLASVDGQAYTWSDNGNLLSDGTTRYAYDQANRMISVTLGMTTTQYAYNGDGARLRQITSGTPTTYTQDLAAPLPVVLQSKTGTNVTQYVYALGTRPLAQSATGWEYLLADALGSVRQIVDANGKVTLAESYTPYGKLLNSSGSGLSIFGYGGEQIDSYIKLVFLTARYMDPRLGMFLSHDPWSGKAMRPGSMNGWGYVEEDPVNSTDPSGLCTGEECASTKDITEVEDRYHVVIEPKPDYCTALEFPIGPDNYWSTVELPTLVKALDMTKTFLDHTIHPFDTSIGNRGYVIYRVTTPHYGTQMLTTFYKPIPFQKKGYVWTEVPDNQFDDPDEARQAGRFMHEFFHAFDFFTWSILGGWSDERAFQNDTPDVDGACGPTAYSCGSQYDSFADSAAAYALEWLSEHNQDPQNFASQALDKFADAGRPRYDNYLAKRVEHWKDSNPLYSRTRREALDAGFGLWGYGPGYGTGGK